MNDQGQSRRDGRGTPEQQLAALTARARRALEEVELSPNAWARVRGAMPDSDPEAAAEVAGRGRGVWWWLALAGAAAAAAWVVLQPASLNEGVRPAPVAEVHPNERPRPDGLADADADAPVVLLSGQADVASFAPGATITAGDEPLAIHAFGRHVITFAPATRAVLAEWSPEAVSLELQAGTVRCEVHRAAHDELFEVRAADVSARVMGTVFTVSIGPEEEVRVAVEHGVVAVDRDGHERFVGAGESWGSLRSLTDVAEADTTEPEDAAAASVSDDGAASNEASDAVGEVAAAPRPTAKASARSKSRREAAPKKDTATRRTVVADAELETEVVIDVGSQSMGGAPSGGRDLLAPVVRKIRAGHCDRALGALRAIVGELGDRTPADTYYLMGWCYRKLGKTRSADAFFARYRSTPGAGGWPLPKSAEDALPLPAVGDLSP